MRWIAGDFSPGSIFQSRPLAREAGKHYPQYPASPARLTAIWRASLPEMSNQRVYGTWAERAFMVHALRDPPGGKGRAMFEASPRQLFLAFDPSPVTFTATPAAPIEVDMVTAAAAVGAFRAGESRESIAQRLGIGREQLMAVLTVSMAAAAVTEARVLARLDQIGIGCEEGSQ